MDWTAYEMNEHHGWQNLLVLKLNEDGHEGTWAETPGTMYLAQGRGWWWAARGNELPTGEGEKCYHCLLG